MVGLAPAEARACGGTFCDGGNPANPSPMPVDQTGENILFVMGDGFVEAHIQIQYDPDTDAMNFAWIVPVLSLPEFSVGSERLMANVLDSTVPSYGFNTSMSCNPPGSSMSGASASSTSPTTADPTGFNTDGGSTGGGGPEVVLEEVVGAFEVTVLSGGTGEEVVDWLDMNGYQQDPDAVPIIDEYLAEDFMFAAFKLTTSADVSEIHPIVLRFENDEACVPLRLTRIAVVDDMEVRAFFLADHRVVPETYRHVLVNPLKLNWPAYASNYKSVITAAVDADMANGRAFVTEYAGPSDIVDTSGLGSDSWDATVFGTIAPEEVVGALENQGLMSCSGGFGGTATGGGDGTACSYGHTLLRGILNAFLPVPDGVDEVDFYGCLSCFQDQIDTDAWDGPGFAMAMQERIIDPAFHARDVLSAFPTLTRMYTTISGHEMIADPFFYENPDLAEVDLRNEVANRTILCSGQLWTLPDGRTVFLPGGAWPDFPGEMPWEEDVEAMMPAGAPMSLVDNTEQIDELLAAWNCQNGYPQEECGAGATDSDTDGVYESDGDTDTAGESSGGSGCGCHSGAGGLGFAVVGFLMAFGVGRRRQTRTPGSGPMT